MAPKDTLKLDNYTKGLLIRVITQAISVDKELSPDDIRKLKEVKKELQE